VGGSLVGNKEKKKKGGELFPNGNFVLSFFFCGTDETLNIFETLDEFEMGN
jgi:hypothetical protein